MCSYITKKPDFVYHRENKYIVTINKAEHSGSAVKDMNRLRPLEH
jgi:hypothetical protein